MNSLKQLYLENLGCAKNQVDAEQIMEQFMQAGWSVCDEADAADLIIVNTCGFINPAKEESIDRLLALKQSFPDKKVIAAGCLSQRYAKDLSESLLEIDGFLGNRDLLEIPDRVQNLIKQNKRIDTQSFQKSFESEGEVLTPLRSKLLNHEGFAYVKIAEGCHHGCSYCAIPLIRGGVRSRGVEDIVHEISMLVDGGIKEIALVAQDLFSYRWDDSLKEVDANSQKKLQDGTPFLDLLNEIFKLKQDFSIRLLYMHPDALNLGLLELMKKEKRLLPYLDIPFQHASNSILKSMGRKATMEDNLALISKIKSILPDVVLRSTFLLGYPGESGEDREKVLEFIKQAQLDWAGFFIYSREEGTVASSLTNEVKNSRTIKAAKKFLPQLEELQQAISISRMSRFVNRDLDVLIEEAVEGENLYIGRCWLQAPDVDGLTVIQAKDLTPGDIVRCHIVRTNGFDLEAKCV